MSHIIVLATIIIVGTSAPLVKASVHRPKQIIGPDHRIVSSALPTTYPFRYNEAIGIKPAEASFHVGNKGAGGNVNVGALIKDITNIFRNKKEEGEYFCWGRPWAQTAWNRHGSNKMLVRDIWTDHSELVVTGHGAESFAVIKGLMKTFLFEGGHMGTGHVAIRRQSRNVSAWCCARGWHHPMLAVLWIPLDPDSDTWKVIANKYADLPNDPGVTAQCGGSTKNYVWFSSEEIGPGVDMDQLHMTCLGAISDDPKDPITPVYLGDETGVRALENS